MISQTLNLAPADKKLYSLRDATATVESIPLIASSIMSKKIASGAEKIVIDVTVGSGAFMKNVEDAEKLANEMIEIGRLANRETVCVLTNMDEPLGKAIGNTLEVIEAIKALKGEMPEDLETVVLELGSYMLMLACIEKDLEKAKQNLKENLQNGKAYNKFLELVKSQGGDITYIKDTEKFEKARYIKPIHSNINGYINKMNAKEIGKIACGLGAGRIKKEDKIDNSVGIVLNKKVGEKVNKNEVLAYIYSNNEQKLEYAKKELYDIIKIGEEKFKNQKTIIKVIH